MKNKILRAVIFYSIIFISLYLMGCKAKQKPAIVVREIVTAENSDYSRVKSELERSKAINDSLETYIGNIRTAKPECDSVCQEAIERVLSSLNNKKTSGKNSFGIYYDKYKKSIVAYANLEETVQKYKDSISTIREFKGTSIEIPVPAPYPVPAELSKEQKLNLLIGRLFWIVLILWGFFKIRKLLPV